MIRSDYVGLMRIAAQLARGEYVPPLDEFKWCKSTPLMDRRAIEEILVQTANRHRALADDIRMILRRNAPGQDMGGE